ncbi:MAG: DNA polymerase III subunit delta [Tepidisphaerales bacterium]
MARQLKPVYALVGDDSFLQMETIAEIDRQLDDAQRSTFDGEQAQLPDVLDEVRSFSMFGGGKLVIVRSADEFVSRYREGLERFCQSLADSGDAGTSVLVLRLSSLPANTRLHKLIARVGEVVKCEPPRMAELPAWIVRRARSMHRVDIAQDAALQLADLIGSDLGRLDAELARLVLMLPDPPAPQVITTELVRASVAFQREQEVKEVVALLARGRVADALHRWRQLLTTDAAAEYKATTWLMLWLERARSALDLKEKSAPPQMLSRATWISDPVELREFMSVATRLGRGGVTRLLKQLAELDRRIKSGLGEPAVLIERFIATALT